MSNPGKTITIHDIAQLLGKTYPRAFTPENVTTGFRVTGIYHVDRAVFSEDEFLSAYVTETCPAAIIKQTL